MIRTTIQLTPDQRLAIEELAADRGMSISAIVAVAIDCLLEEDQADGYDKLQTR